MDIASLAGIILGAVMFVFGVFSNGGFEALKNMVDSASIIITVGGSISGVLAAHKLPDFINGLKGITLTFKEKAEDPAETIKKIIDLSNVARKEGLLALEEAANDIEDDFMKKGVSLLWMVRVRNWCVASWRQACPVWKKDIRSNRILGRMGRIRSCMGYDRYADRSY